MVLKACFIAVLAFGAIGAAQAMPPGLEKEAQAAASAVDAPADRAAKPDASLMTSLAPRPYAAPDGSR